MPGNFPRIFRATFASSSILSLLGDGDYKPYVSCDPDVTTVEMDGSEDFAVVACDGLWDTVTPEDAARTVLKTVAEDPGELFKENITFPLSASYKLLKKESENRTGNVALSLVGFLFSPAGAEKFCQISLRGF